MTDKTGSPRKRWVGFFGLLLLISFFVIIVIVPCFLLVDLYGRLTGNTVTFFTVLGVSALWFIISYLLIHVIMVFRRHKDEETGAAPYSSPMEMFSEVMNALDSISSGNYNVSVRNDERFRYNDLAIKVNKLAKDLQSVEQMRQEFVSNVSHEIQSPLTSISGFASLLKKEDLSPEKRLHYLNVIEAESTRLSKLSDNLLKLSSLDSEHPPLNIKTFRLDKQIQSTLLMLEQKWLEKRLDLNLDLAPVSFQGDEDLLSQVWINLLHNAIKFTQPYGQISISLVAADGKIQCMIADTGIGIAEENLIHVFERFYKVDKARERSMGGNGLGLSLVKRIVEIHGGAIFVKSEPEKGTTFFIELEQPPLPPGGAAQEGMAAEA